MKILPVFLCFLFFFPYLAGQDDLGEEDEHLFEDETCEEDVCLEKQEPDFAIRPRSCRRYYCPVRYTRFDYYDRDLDPSWPAKIENSFIEDLRR